MKRTHKYSRPVLLAALLMAMNASGAFSQSSGGTFTITSQVVAGGGCGPDGSGGCTPSIGSGNLVVTGTAAEPGAAELSNQSPFSLRGGFWYATLGATPTAANGTVTGTIVDGNGNAVAGSVIRLSGTQNRKTITDANGNYHFDNVETNGFYTVSPSRANYNFTPLNRSFSLVGNKTDAVFAATATGDSANPLDTPEYFVRQEYLDILGREPDEGGFNYWSDQINECNGESNCLGTKRIDVAAAFFIAQEFQASGAYIYNLYSGALGRQPRFAEYAGDRQLVIGGASLETEKQSFAAGFVERAEFVGKYQANTAAESFVDALLTTVQQGSGVELSSQRDDLIARYQMGATQNDSRILALRGLAENETFKHAQYNASFVLTEYFAYLRRDAETQGYAFWLNVLNNATPGDYRGMICSFITSTEYQRRFSIVVTRGNGECGR
jgi:Carboxypeptidase regulatory-like domain/Domain of unknown function (DUF4214)